MCAVTRVTAQLQCLHTPNVNFELRKLLFFPLTLLMMKGLLLLNVHITVW